MSEDGFPDPYDEPSMELIIETLTGTTFEMRVYPTDYVLDIKNKIQRIEGIPVHHQNLLYQMKELQDYARLSDVGIGNGSTLKLVLAMRGGPISTRRLNTCDHHIVWKDLKDLIEHTRDDLAGDRGSKVSVLVFKEGEVLNMIRVIENEDGSYSPYTDKAISPPHGCHASSDGGCLNTNNTSSHQNNGTSSKHHHHQQQQQQQQHRGDLRQAFKKMTEDVEMATKLHALKMRMRRVRQLRHSRDADAATSSNTDSTTNNKNNNNDGGVGHADDLDLELGEIALKEKHRSRTRRVERNGFLHVFETGSGSGSSGCGLGGGLSASAERRDLLQPLYRESDEDVGATVRNNRVRLERLGLVLQEQQDDLGTMEENSSGGHGHGGGHHGVGAGYSTATTTTQCKVGLLKRTTSLDYDADFGLGLEPSGSDVEPDDIFYRLPSLPRFTTTATTTSSSTAPPPKCDLYMDGGDPLRDNVQTATTTTRSPLYGRRSRNEDNSLFSPLQQHHHLSGGVGGAIERFDDFAEFDYEDLDPQDLFDYYNADFRKINEEANLANEIKKLTLKPEFVDVHHHHHHNVTNTGSKTCLSSISSSSTSSSSSSSSGSSNNFNGSVVVSGGNSGKGASSSGNSNRELPAVVTKKRMRCGQCNKRLNITNIYNCRCGKMFCSQHRYSESHDCQYDYKSEGRKLLEQQNPLVTASKLTKF